MKAKCLTILDEGKKSVGETVPEENRELSILQKEKGSWKIDRYMFNKMK